MDDFVWCYVFQQVGSAAQLARLRLVCQRWRAVIDAEERLWRALVERDFGWKQSESRTGKGARRRQTRHIDYQSLYRNLSISTKALTQQHGVARKEGLMAELQQRQQAKLSSFMCHILPHVLELQIRRAANAKPPNTYTRDYLQSHAQSWLACTHPHARSYSLVCKDCQLGMTPKTYQPDEYWEKNWPKVLDYRLGQRKARESMAHRFQGLFSYHLDLDNS
ncbi:uncharacterized protein ACA1_255400 [Acanthamoeba castellanii str. Neff]|uniref:F-box domain-containing protein n=1 Tax=Acanthamoeba castellanii (strain ATCC 30010 / Neff) TaxID=1257118 RepID=L8HDF8_ACACF|nr:uncharacterized protein ACA1_255400 [Acanthamoeba castellanii str. Neff]ELR22431.1 hypothetical protein ACA1_255400 [Acanthamoeba castellanii str. Neff]